MNLSGVLFSRRGPADDGANCYQRGFIGDRLSLLNCTEKLLNVFNVASSFSPVNDLNVPAIGFVTLLKVLGEGNLGVIFNRDLVRVIQNDQVPKLLMTCKRRCLRCHALLHVSIASNAVNVVIKWTGTRLGVRVEQASLKSGSVGEPHC